MGTPSPMAVATPPPPHLGVYNRCCSAKNPSFSCGVEQGRGGEGKKIGNATHNPEGDQIAVVSSNPPPLHHATV